MNYAISTQIQVKSMIIALIMQFNYANFLSIIRILDFI